MNIVILDDYQDAVRKLACSQLLEPYTAKVYTNTVKGTGQLAVRLKDAEVLVLIRERTHFNRALIEKLPKLKLISQLKMISQTGKVGAHIDVAACTDKGIAVAEGVGSPIAPAELTWALIMAGMRRLPQYISNLKHGAWQQSGLKNSTMPVNFGVGMVLHQKNLGIWGFGKIGQLVAGYAKAFGMKVVIWGSEASRALAQQQGYESAPSREAFFEQADVLSLHLRLNPDVLIAALSRGRPGLAAIDVFESEPVLQGHALLRLENCICTPHIGYVEQNSYELYFSAAFTNVVNFIQGTPTHIVNLEALSKSR